MSNVLLHNTFDVLVVFFNLDLSWKSNLGIIVYFCCVENLSFDTPKMSSTGDYDIMIVGDYQGITELLNLTW